MTPTQQMNTLKAVLGMAGIICSSFPRAARTGIQRKEPSPLHRSTILNSKDVKSCPDPAFHMLFLPKTGYNLIFLSYTKKYLLYLLQPQENREVQLLRAQGNVLKQHQSCLSPRRPRFSPSPWPAPKAHFNSF